MSELADRLGLKPRDRSRRLFWAGSSSLIVIVCATVAGLFYWEHLKTKYSSTDAELSQKITWRARIFAGKATGRIPELTWGDLWYMIKQREGFSLENVAYGMTTAGAVTNPYNTDEDIEAAAAIFGRKCAMCHGAEGAGWNAPALDHGGLKHGDSDLAIYKVLRDGIPGTSMVALELSRVERWQLVGFLKHLMSSGSDWVAEHDYQLRIEVSRERLAAAGSRSDEWLTYSRSFDGHRYSPLNQITAANVSQLRIRWVHQFNTSDPTIEATPLVVDDVIFTTSPPSNAFALDARTGDTIWRYDHPVSRDLPVCCGWVNRGLAILGRTVFLGTMDGYLIALEANTGKVVWKTRVADPADRYSITGAPLVVGNSVAIGVAGGDYGIRGFLAAFDPETGEQRWKFYTIPGPGETGHETWLNDAWKTGGGATWTIGSYDPDLGLLYWGVGNPAPDYNGDVRPGDNLFSNSVIALHADTGKLAWHFQFTPHDEHDWDATQTPILTDITIDGQTRKVLCWANRNGFYYVLDRTNGEFLRGVPFVELDWAEGLDKNGRPIIGEAGEVSGFGRLTKPAYAGGTNWQNPALDQAKGWFFVHATEGASVFTKSSHAPPPPNPANGQYLGSNAYTPSPLKLVVRALDVATGERKWEYFSPPLRRDQPFSFSGLLVTSSNLLFGASGGSVFAVESSTGRELWRVFLGGDTRAAPITFTVDGEQVIAVSVGRSLFVFGL